jgi:hypothetical protein
MWRDGGHQHHHHHHWHYISSFRSSSTPASSIKENSLATGRPTAHDNQTLLMMTTAVICAPVLAPPCATVSTDALAANTATLLARDKSGNSHQRVNDIDVFAAVVAESAPLTTVDADFFSLTADSSRFTESGGNRTVAQLINPVFRTMISGLAPLVIRVGGTFTDYEVFPDGPAPGSDNPGNVTQLNVSLAAWSAMCGLVSSLSGSRLVVSVSGLQRKWHESSVPWDSTNAEAFIVGNKRRGCNVYAYELGNEPGCWAQHGGAVPPATHALDFDALQKVLARHFPDPLARPLVIGPDTTGCMGYPELQEILAASPRINITSVHVYSVSPTATVDDFLESAVGNALCMHSAKQAAHLAASPLAGAPLWNGEGGESYLTTGGGGFLHQVRRLLLFFVQVEDGIWNFCVSNVDVVALALFACKSPCE